MGTAAVPSELTNYGQIIGDQFSVVTPGNEMKWQLVEPTRGTYDWSGGDNLVAISLAPECLHRGHRFC